MVPHLPGSDSAANDVQSKASLEAELKRLEKQLERKLLEQEVMSLEKELSTLMGVGQKSNASDPLAIDDHDVNAWEQTKEVGADLGLEEDVKQASISTPASRAAVTTTFSIQKGMNTSPRGRVSTKMNPFSEKLSQIHSANELAEILKAAQAASGREKAVSKAAVLDSLLPDLPPFSPRTIPNIPASMPMQETPMEVLLGPKLYEQGKLIATTTTAGCHGQDLIMLYFAAAWRSECKEFDPLLIDFYKIAAIPNKIECIYISSDRNLQEFKDYFSKVPFLSMATQTSALKNSLAQNLKLVDWPSLVVLQPSTGMVVTTRGVIDVHNLSRRDVAQCNALVAKWKSTTPIPLSEVVDDHMLKHGTMDRGYLYWQE